MAAAGSRRRPRPVGPSVVTRPRDKELSKRKNHFGVHIYRGPASPPAPRFRGQRPSPCGWRVGMACCPASSLQSSAQPQFHPASLHGDRRRWSQVSWPTLSSAEEARVEPASSRGPRAPCVVRLPGPRQQQLGLVWSGCVPRGVCGSVGASIPVGLGGSRCS